MRMIERVSVLIGLIAVFFQVSAGAEETAKDNAAVNDPAFHAKLLEIAGKYESFGRVDDLVRFAPTLCWAPPPSIARFSESKDAGTHGQKLYFLFASDPQAYLKVEKESASIGQSIVKEAWIPIEVLSPQKPNPIAKKAEPFEVEKKSQGADTANARIFPLVKKDGKAFHAETKAELFIMTKLDPKTPNTDEGWVYGTVSANGKTVTSAGRVQSCMQCHQAAPHGRLFGLKLEKIAEAAAPFAKALGEWSGTWVDTWKYKGQGGELTCTLTAGEGNELRAVFRAPGFLTNPRTVTLKVKAEGAGYTASGAEDLGKPAGVLTFKAQLSGEKFSGEYDSAEERGTFEMKKK